METWWQLALRKEVIKRSLKTSLIVGTILAFINHGDAIWALSVPSDRAIKMVLTYVVPYLVSTSASIGAIRHHNNLKED
jgi:hypothetical protein